MTEYTFKDLNRFGVKVQARVERVVARLALTAFRNVTQMSPVDTGRFRASWQYSETETMPPPRTAPKQKRGGPKLPPPDLPDISERVVVAWVVNNVDYGPALEAGHSRRARNGIVGPTMQRIEALMPGIVRQESGRA